MKRNLLMILLVVCCVVMVGCEKDIPIVENQGLKGDVWVLNEGTWGNNDAGLSLIDTRKKGVMNDCFAMWNGRRLGDVAQDLMLYGSKMYVVVWNSNVMEVLDVKTGKSIKQISFEGKGPRYATKVGGKVYVCCYDGTVSKIDTTSLEIEANCEVKGYQPEGICVVGNKLCVVHAWKKNSNSSIIYDSTMSVVDIATFKTEKKITVGMNPFKVVPYDEKSVIVGYNGDFGIHKGGVELVDLETGLRRELMDDGASKFVLYRGEVYGYQFDYSSQKALFWKINVATGEKNEILTATGIKTPYSIDIDPRNGDIYVGDAQQFRSSGDMHCYTQEGQLKWSVEVGMCPSKCVFVKK